MDDLLNFALEARGGLNRWGRVEAVPVAASISGELWRERSGLTI